MMKILRHISIAASGLAALLSCSGERLETEGDITVCLECGKVKGQAGYGNDGIWDINLFVTGDNGIAEYHRYVSFSSPKESAALEKLRLLYGKEYTLYAIANAGFDTGALNEEELESYRLHLIYPDHFERGFPMAGKKVITPMKGVEEELRLERLVSRISVKLDRSLLDDDIDFNIAGAKVGNCPEWVKPFDVSRAEDAAEDLFPSGYYTRGNDMFDVFLAENVQGELRQDLCSYLEMDIDYSSGSFYTEGSRCLKYRFYLREHDNYRVERNSHYRVTVRPEKDGLLCDDSWRVDKSGLTQWSGDPYLRISPGGSTEDGIYYEYYYSLERNGSMHFSVASFPKTMKIWLRDDLVEDEITDGRAEYKMDADGKGFTVTSLGKACMSMMELHAGEPLNDYIMICVCVP